MITSCYDAFVVVGVPGGAKAATFQALRLATGDGQRGDEPGGSRSQQSGPRIVRGSVTLASDGMTHFRHERNSANLRVYPCARLAQLFEVTHGR